MLNSKEFVRELQLRHESAWMNPNVGSAETALAALSLTRTDVDDAEARLERFAPFIKKVFPETAADRGLIESPLTEIENMRAWLNENEGAQLAGKLFLKRDSDLPVAGSVKARGGCYAVLKHTEDLALANRLVETRDDYSVFATRAFRNFFSQYELHVGSTGNLGLSIGIMGAALGYRVTVHMSADARRRTDSPSAALRVLWGRRSRRWSAAASRCRTSICSQTFTPCTRRRDFLLSRPPARALPVRWSCPG